MSPFYLYQVTRHGEGVIQAPSGLPAGLTWASPTSMQWVPGGLAASAGSDGTFLVMWNAYVMKKPALHAVPSEET